jgi:hypothetical protein
MQAIKKFLPHVIAIAFGVAGFLIGKMQTGPGVDLEAMNEAFRENEEINQRMNEWRNSSNRLKMVQSVLKDPSMNYLDFSIDEVKLKITEMEQRLSEVSEEAHRDIIESEIEYAKSALQLAVKFKSSSN